MKSILLRLLEKFHLLSPLEEDARNQKLGKVIVPHLELDGTELDPAFHSRRGDVMKGTMC
jgi:hypothetical protein